MTNSRNRLLTLLVTVLLSFLHTAEAQKTYFVYLQSDNQQPFYVTINGKNQSSSSMGYAILSKLHDSTYPIKVGFAGGGTPIEFNLSINGNDQGFLIKEFAEKGYGLFNLQTMAVVMNSNEANKRLAQEALAKQEALKREADSLAAASLAAAQKQQDLASIAATLVADKKQADSTAAAEVLTTIRVTEKQTNDSASTTAVSAAQAIPADSVAINHLSKEITKSDSVQTAVAAVAVAGNTDKVSNEKAAETGANKPVVAVAPVAAVAAAAADAVLKSNKTESATAPEKAAVADTEGGENTKALIASDTAQDGNAKSANVSTDSAARQPAVIAVDSLAKAVKTPKPDTTGSAVAALALAPAVAAKRDTTDRRFLDMEIAVDTTAFAVKPQAMATDTITAKVINMAQATDSAALSVKSTSVPAAPPTENNEVKATITSNNGNTVIVGAPAIVTATNPVAESKPEVTTTPAEVNNICKKIAGDKDYQNLRKKMASSADVPQMILEAKAAFKSKCYTNEQLRNLCLLFNDDASRLRFLDEAYPYSTDQQAYRQLGSLLRDDFYTRRFNAILK